MWDDQFGNRYADKLFLLLLRSPLPRSLEVDAPKKAASRQHQDQQRAEGELWARHRG